MSDETLYSDNTVVLDNAGLTLRCYYFPWGGSKRIPYGKIREIRTWTMTGTSGKKRLWGAGDFVRWAPLDTRRSDRETAILFDLGGVIKPWFSPESPDQVLSILRERTNAPQVQR